MNEQEKQNQEIENLKKENAALKKEMKRLERDKHFLAVSNKNTKHIFDQKEAQKSLYYLYNELLLENCPNMIMLFDENMNYVVGTAVCLEGFGHRDNSSIKGHYLREVFENKMDKECVRLIEERCRNILKTLESGYYNEKIDYLDGSYIYAQVVISPVIDDKNQCRGVLVIINDITEITLTKEKAEEAARSKSSFLANMSHEIRTPMNAIKGLSELLMLTELNQLQKDYVKNIVKSSNSLLGIINDILDFSKIDANKMDIMLSAYDLGAFIEDVTSVINLRAKDKDLLFVIDVEQNLPKVLKGDDVRLKQVLFNILSNAVKYTKEGYFKLKVNGERVNKRLKLLFEVEDTGIGIKEEDFPKMFEAFARFDLHTNRSIMGTGLGLAITKRLIQVMNGDISVDSVYGKGTTFTFWVWQDIVDDMPLVDSGKYAKDNVLVLDNGLRGISIKNILSSMNIKHIYCDDESKVAGNPLRGLTHLLYSDAFDGEILKRLREQLPYCHFVAIKDLRTALNQSGNNDDVLYEPVWLCKVAAVLDGKSDEMQESRTDLANNIDNIKFDNVKALIVDDNEINLMVGGEMLRSYDIEVTEAEGGKEAIDLCDKVKYDIIFMDHMMPEMDGIEASQHIRRSSSLNYNTPIVALTANVVDGMHAQYLESGMNDFVSKPIDVNQLHRVLKKWLLPEKVQEEHSSKNDDKNSDNSKDASFDLVSTLDDFGMYATDVMNEIGQNMPLYVRRLENALHVMGHIVAKLKTEVKNDDWASFTEEVDHLREMLFEIGARDCAGRAKNLKVASQNGNIDYINMDFFSLMDNMYILEKKLDVLVPLAKGSMEELDVLNNISHIKLCLIKMDKAFKDQKLYEANKQLERLFSISLDKELDMQLLQIKKAMEAGGTVVAAKVCDKILASFK